jgi:RND family efflux transporter MFP subunit
MARVALLAAVAAALIAHAACGRQQQAEPADAAAAAVPVVAMPVQLGTIRTVVRAAGSITAPADAEFLAATPEPASILEVTRSEGEMAATGDVLVRLDIPTARQEVARQQAEVARAQAAIENASVTVTKTQDVVDRGLVPRRDLENAQRELSDAQTALARAQAALQAAEAAADRALIRAPFPGVVVTRFHSPGDVLSGITSDPILRFIDPSRLEVTATMKAEDAARVAQGATARLAIVTEAPPTRLTVASRAPGSGTDQVVRLRFEDPCPLPVDSAVQIDIDAEERANTMFVPAEAIIKDKELSVVFVAVSNRAERRVVTTGIADDVRVEITNGLARGEMVITQGHIGLVDGTPINVDTASP